MQHSDWYFTGEIYDHPAKDISCDLCNHERLRYEYVIKNKNTNEVKSVGSSCILKFADIILYDDHGQFITKKEERKKALNEAFERFKFEHSLKPLRALYKAMFEVDRHKIERIVNFAKQKKGITPNDLIWLFSSMKNNGIEYNPGLYKIYSRDLSSQIDLKMAVRQPDKLDLIYHALSASQKKTCGIADNIKQK